MKRIQYEQMARIGQAIASAVRLRALNLLAQRPWRVGELAQELGESVAATSAQLKVLRASGLIVEEKRGRETWCRIECDDVFRLLTAAQRTAEAVLPELRELVRAEDDDPFVLRAMDLRDLVEDVARERVTLLDLRPSQEYLAAHIPGAQSLPVPELDSIDLHALHLRERLVAYCRGPWCLMARKGVQTLNDRGIPTRRLRLGVVDWRAEGLKLVIGPMPV
jgi:rhodanese-related sulfurtransferase